MSMLEIIKCEKGIVVVRILEKKISEVKKIEEISRQLFSLVEEYGCRRMVIDYYEVEYLSSLMLKRLIFLQKKIYRARGQLVLCGLSCEIYKFFVITRLHQFFRICDTEIEGFETISGAVA